MLTTLLAAVGGCFLGATALLTGIAVTSKDTRWAKGLPHPAFIGLGYASALTLFLTGFAVVTWLVSTALRLVLGWI